MHHKVEAFKHISELSPHFWIGVIIFAVLVILVLGVFSEWFEGEEIE